MDTVQTLSKRNRFSIPMSGSYFAPCSSLQIFYLGTQIIDKTHAPKPIKQLSNCSKILPGCIESI